MMGSGITIERVPWESGARYEVSVGGMVYPFRSAEEAVLMLARYMVEEGHTPRCITGEEKCH